MPSVCHPHPDKIERFYTDAFTDEMYPDTDTDDNIIPNVI